MSHTFKDFHWSREINIKKYLLPQTMTEALEMLAEENGEARIIAGGTDLIPQLRHGSICAETLIDISQLSGLSDIDRHDDSLVIGGLVTHTQVADSELIREKAQSLSEACACVGSPQIRNIATVAGNLTNGHPAADAAMPLLALDASVTIVSAEGKRVVPLADFFLGKEKTVLDRYKEIVSHIQFPVPGENQGDNYQRLSKRGSLTIAVLILSAVVEADRENNVITDARIALGPVAARPIRALKTEESLRGAPISLQTIETAAESVCNESHPLTDPVWGSAEYKLNMVNVFTRRAITRALNQIDISVN